MNGSETGPSETSKLVGKVAVATVAVLAIIAVGWLAITLTRFLMLVFAAIVFASIFDAMADHVVRYTRMKRPYALAAAIVVLLALFAGIFTLFGSQLAQQFDTITESIPPALSALDTLLRQLGFDSSLRDLLQQGSSDVSKILSQAGNYALAAGSGIADFVLVFVGAIFIASDPGVYRRGLLLLLPRRAEPVVDAAMDDASRGLRGWMLGQAVSSLLVAALTFAGLALLGVPAAGGLGLIAGLLDVIPMIGPIISGVPAVLLAFTVSPMTAVWTVVLFLAVQQLQGNFLQPMIQKQAVNVPPAVLLFAVVGFGILFGMLGVLLAAPLTVVSFVLVQRIYVRTLLGKKIEIAGEERGDAGELDREG